MQTKSPSNLKVIDVSHHQGSINWPKVKSDGVDGAFIKATEGKTGIDSKFSSNATGAILAGLKVGYYHYAHPENNPAEVEAANFVNKANGFAADFPHVLDVEGKADSLGAVKLTAWCVAWLKEVERLTGHSVMIYTGASFARSYLGKELSKWPLWIAHYGAAKPMENNIWSEWSVFQYADNVKVSGITGSVDMNVMEKAFYDKHTIKLPAPEPTPTENIKVIVDDKLTAYGRIIKGHVYLPICKLGEELGYVVDWNARAATPYINGKPITFYEAIDGLTYIGVRAVAELLGGTVSWNVEEKKVFFYK
ncbi:hypothetical protein Back11_12200 [Paenibacillus baekrokdamisoli]|uniref:Uncharacterized protein n=1 Tax=Paenibacillus baekrokdamisoli TaxID=1712516 RepID=A0A3G9IUY0_9BACL|nr:GH25 family lysozyme [Paenibacillus baekrokdamisoli]MBB3070525.1 lysozyme [Paenibacillus baekrokdamisoli]BBH19875.1 hypothetical protein Back11_12200 [Paenibacillus baekrokdamisoli]